MPVISIDVRLSGSPRCRYANTELGPFKQIPPMGRGDDWMTEMLRRMWSDEAGQDIAEYAVMLAVILVIVVGTIRLVGGNANNAFSEVASSLK